MLFTLFKNPIDINKKKGVSLSIKPNIKKRPKLSGNKSKFGGLSKLKTNENIRIKKPLDENKKEIPTAIVMCGKAINGYKSLFSLVKKFVKYNFANIAWDNIKEIKVDNIPTEIDK